MGLGFRRDTDVWPAYWLAVSLRKAARRRLRSSLAAKAWFQACVTCDTGDPGKCSAHHRSISCSMLSLAAVASSDVSLSMLGSSGREEMLHKESAPFETRTGCADALLRMRFVCRWHQRSPHPEEACAARRLEGRNAPIQPRWVRGRGFRPG